MHPNPAFRATPEARAMAFVRDRGFGALTVSAPEGPLMSHVPGVVSADGAGVEMHLVRSTPLARALAADEGAAGEGIAALWAVAGPDGYVSPDWYGVEDQVPTWNYVAVHLRGTLSRLPDAALRPHLDALSEAFETRLAPKPPWRTDKMPEDLMARMMRGLIPVRLSVERVESTFKLGQNKPEPARLSAAEALGASGIGAETMVLSRLMRHPPEGT